MEKPIKIHDLGVPVFLETLICIEKNWEVTMRLFHLWSCWDGSTDGIVALVSANISGDQSLKKTG